MARRAGGRKGRGRLSSIEQLPEEAGDIVVWASRELSKRERTQLDIYAEFKQRLIALQGELGLGFDIPAFSSFNRFSMRQAELGRRMEETRQISSALADRFDGVGNEDLTIMTIEAIKTLIFEIVSAGGEAGASPEDAMMMARAIQSLVSASKMSQAQRAVFQAELEARTDEAIDKASVVAREAGVSAEVIAQMRREFLGVRPKAAKPDKAESA
jgi:hypothetical protein